MSSVANPGGGGEENIMKKLAVRVAGVASGLVALALAGGAGFRIG
jgi:hypothetical protein